MIILNIVRCILKPVAWILQAVLSLIAAAINFMGVLAVLIGGLIGAIGLVSVVICACNGMLVGGEIVKMLIISVLFFAIPSCLHQWGVSEIYFVKGILSKV